MTYHLISKIGSLHHQITCEGPGNVSALLKGKTYYSVTSGSIPYDQYPDSFILYFPHTPIFIKSITIQINEDVFPTEWHLSVSYDNTSYTSLIESTEPLCSKENWRKYNENSISCSISEIKTIFVQSEQPSSSYFLKFGVTNTTWMEPSYPAYKKLMTFKYFEVNGLFYVQFPPQTYIHQHKIMNIFMFLFITPS